MSYYKVGEIKASFMAEPRPEERGSGIPEAGFEDLVDLYGGQVLALALNILGNREDAEDVIQEAFIQVYRNLAGYDPGKSFKTWIFTIVYRRCLDMLKKRRRFFAAFERAKHEMPLSSNPGPIAGPLPAEVLGALSAKERTALSLWASEGYTAREISGVLACSESTARVMLFSARKKIKALLENRHASLQNG
jgi:RNA polymerase sigma-70 factor, ECF subfamily